MLKNHAIIFDLDGTLLNTLDDLTASVNAAMKSCGMPVRTKEEVRQFVGNGVMKLIERCVPDGMDNPQFKKAYGAFRIHYASHCQQKTVPYDGIIQLLGKLRIAGVPVAVVSNKFDAAVKKVAERYYPGLFDVAVGESKVTPRKPDPTGLLKAISDLGSVPERTVFVGDTHTDLETARNAGVRCIILSWGYERGDFYETCEADAVMSSAQELLQFAQENDI